MINFDVELIGDLIPSLIEVLMIDEVKEKNILIEKVSTTLPRCKQECAKV